MSDKKTRLLFVISKFEQGGSERFLYEVCKVIDRDKFEIEILTRKRGADRDYYFPLLRQLGIPIHQRMPLPRYGFRRLVPGFPDRLPRYKAFMDRIHRARVGLALRGFFAPYDLVSFIQIDHFYPVQHLFKKDDRVIVHLMSNAFQYEFDYYAECEPDRYYRFVLMDPLQVKELECTRCAHRETMYFPLALDFTARPQMYVPPDPGIPIRIGIVMRLSKNRPIEFLFYAFADLVQTIDATLYVYGQGDPSMFYRTLDLLHIRERVIFAGQQPDLVNMLQRDRPTMIWLTSNGPILGYASVEMASLGMPMMFWDLYGNPSKQVLTQTGGALPAFSTVSDFVAYAIQALDNPHLLGHMGERLRNYIIETHDIHRHIGQLEHYYLAVADRFRTGPSPLH